MLDWPREAFSSSFLLDVQSMLTITFMLVINRDQFKGLFACLFCGKRSYAVFMVFMFVFFVGEDHEGYQET